MFGLLPLLGVLLAAQPVAFLEDERARLEAQEAELRRDIGDPAVMANSTRATIARLTVERGWRQCTANEASILARTSERPAELIAEAAMKACEDWQKLLAQALANGAYPYLEEQVSREDMIASAGLKASKAALERALLWRAGGPSPATAGADASRPSAPAATPPPPPATVTPAAQVPAQVAASETNPDEQVITVVANRSGRCRVRLADKTLSERELAASARIWAANGTPLKVIRPRGASYQCMAKIAWKLGEHGVRLFHFVDPSEIQPPSP